jgi:beta-galactosidase
MRLFSIAAVALLAAQAAGASIKHRLNGFTLLEHPDPAKRDLLQDIVCRQTQTCFTRIM